MSFRCASFVLHQEVHFQGFFHKLWWYQVKLWWYQVMFCYFSLPCLKNVGMICFMCHQFNVTLKWFQLNFYNNLETFISVLRLALYRHLLMLLYTSDMIFFSDILFMFIIIIFLSSNIIWGIWSGKEIIPIRKVES